MGTLEERITECLRSVFVRWNGDFTPIFVVPDWLLKEHDLTREHVENWLKNNHLGRLK